MASPINNFSSIQRSEFIKISFIFQECNVFVSIQNMNKSSLGRSDSYSHFLCDKNYKNYFLNNLVWCVEYFKERFIFYYYLLLFVLVAYPFYKFTILPLSFRGLRTEISTVRVRRLCWMSIQITWRRKRANVKQ